MSTKIEKEKCNSNKLLLITNSESVPSRLFYAVLVAFLVLYPLHMLLRTGYYSDDFFNSQIRGALLAKKMSLGETILTLTMNWIKAGRFFPLSNYGYVLFYIIDSLIVYKTIVLSAIILDLLLFSYLLKLITRSNKIVLLSLLVMPIFFQFRNYHDPILSFGLLLQVIFMLLMIALISFQHFLDTKKTSFLMVSLLAYQASLLIYEISYVFVVFFLMLSYSNDKNPRIILKNTYLYILSVALVVSFVFFLRSHTQVIYSGTKTNVHWIPFLKTLAVQWYGAIPLSYFFSHATNFMIHVRSLDIVYGLSLAFAVYLLLRNLQVRIDLRFLGVFGFVLATLPAMLISLSGRYQVELAGAWGIAYLPVYLQYFGIFMMLISILIFALSRIHLAILKSIIVALLAIAIAAIGIINMKQNQAVTEQMNDIWKYPRDVIEMSLQKGLLDAVPDNSVILMNYPVDITWQYKPLFTRYSHKSIEVIPIKDYNDRLKSEKKTRVDLLGRNIFMISYIFEGHDTVGISFGKVAEYLFGQKMDGYSVKVDKPVIYYISYSSAQDKAYVLKNPADQYKAILSEKKNTVMHYVACKFNSLYYYKTESSVFEPYMGVLHPQANAISPITLRSNFSIEIILKPFQKQVAYAVILGNHPGYGLHEGFVIQQDSANLNNYTFGFGDGKTWLPGVKFYLTPNTWSYLVIRVKRNLITVFLNGEPVASADAKKQMMNSAMPLYIYNWGSGDRPFSGKILESRISQDILPTETIMDNWHLIKEHLDKFANKL